MKKRGYLPALIGLVLLVGTGCSTSSLTVAEQRLRTTGETAISAKLPEKARGCKWVTEKSSVYVVLFFEKNEFSSNAIDIPPGASYKHQRCKGGDGWDRVQYKGKKGWIAYGPQWNNG